MPTLEERVLKLEQDNVVFMDALEAAAKALLAHPMGKAMLSTEVRTGLERWIAQREASRGQKQATV